MTFREFTEKYKISLLKFCEGTGISQSTYWNIKRGGRCPRQKTAEAIEKYTKGLVTVKELRGVDEREEFVP